MKMEASSSCHVPTAKDVAPNLNGVNETPRANLKRCKSVRVRFTKFLNQFPNFFNGNEIPFFPLQFYGES